MDKVLRGLHAYNSSRPCHRGTAVPARVFHSPFLGVDHGGVPWSSSPRAYVRRCLFLCLSVGLFLPRSLSLSTYLALVLSPCRSVVFLLSLLSSLLLQKALSRQVKQVHQVNEMEDDIRTSAPPSEEGIRQVIILPSIAVPVTIYQVYT